jgi:ABC-type nitrate/sulfonate/bicarbonate transport system substrate-binding protein
VTTKNTPPHYLLLSMLARSNLTPGEIETVKSNLIFATKTPLAGAMFQRGEADAVAIWEPYLSC